MQTEAQTTRQPFTSSGSDLYFKVQCTCPYKSQALADLGVKHTLMLTGYDDANFFDRVNASPREGKCRCGRAYRVQWFCDGVEFAFLDAQPVAA